MKRILLVLLVATIPASAQWRHFGQSYTRVTGFAGIGASAPVNPIAGRLNTGWNLSGGVGVMNRYAGVMVDAMFADFGLNRDALLREGVRRGSQRFWAFTVDPVFHVNERGPVDFYITGGGGLYGVNTHLRAQSGRFDLISDETLWRPGANGGAGFAFGLPEQSNIKFFIEARYHHMFTPGSGSSFVPVTVGVRF